MKAFLPVFVLLSLIPPSALARQPVVIEMFTSQGCSSCPPADRHVSQLSRTEGVIALAYHVDYWNRIGWTDPFSSSKWTARQNEYASHFKSNQVYTPQAVVAGVLHLVGSDQRAVANAIDEAGGMPESAGGRIDVARTENGFRVEVVTDARKLEAREHEVLVFLVQDAVLTKVLDGESEGKTLRNDRIVRRMERRELAPARTSSTFEIETERGWRFSQGGVVMLIQNRTTRKIVAAVEAAIR